ncbi:flagellar protein FlaG [Bryobacter aggregatus]|uniref:flagellar protein FlaG n=1 Tax=Bryobacter aggregatus TaxID=360054 RepID=UPI0004E1851A|nr:flagellar protein FlaG [Bryobacter aggregatus]
MKLAEISPVPAAEAETLTVKSRQETIAHHELVAAVRELDLPQLQLPNREMSITYDREIGRYIVQILDTESGQVVQQLPGRDVIERVRFYRELEQSS